MTEITLKFRTKTWKLAKNPYGFSLQKQYTTEKNEIAWHILGYFSEPKYIVHRLVKEHFISCSDGRELLSSVKNTCDELGQAINIALKALEPIKAKTSKQTSTPTKGQEQNAP